VALDKLDRYSCGVQSVKVILDYFGRSLSLAAFERSLGTGELLSAELLMCVL
jgi:hypothetical protein